jgi:hypothetical protein
VEEDIRVNVEERLVGAAWLHGTAISVNDAV